MRAERRKRYLAAVLAFLAAFFLVLCTGAAPATLALADTLCAYDQTKLEDDLKGVDLTRYPKDPNALHCLIDGAGFMEYGYSNDMQIASKYYGVYFYLYNPTEREISTRAGANVANMSVSYDAEGTPTEYANIALTVLDHTENNRFYKLRVSDSSALLRREKEYAAAHGGERRYDVAGIQVWFKGDQNATDSRTGAGTVDEKEGVSFTYYCTGYAAGCGASEESTLDMQSKKLDTIKLELTQATYRTGERTGESGFQSTVSSVYFSVPNKYVEDYGQLQVIRAEWYEYKTNYIIVVPPQTFGEQSQNDAVNMLSAVLGYTLQPGEDGADRSVPWNMYHYTGPSDSGKQGLGYNYPKSSPKINRLDWLLKVDDIEQEISPEELETYANNYVGNASDEFIQIGEKRLNANLFSAEVDKGHTRGLNQRTFDARDSSQWLNIKLENTTSSWAYFRHLFHLTDQNYETFVTANDIKPIEEITGEHFKGSATEQAKRLLVAENQLSKFKDYYDANNAENRIYLFRFSVADYEAQSMGFPGKRTVYAARETVYLNFDIIYLGFVLGEKLTIIPTVASPIDIYPPVTPPPEMLQDHWKEILGWLIGLTAVSFAGIVISAGVKQAIRKVKEKTR